MELPVNPTSMGPGLVRMELTSWTQFDQVIHEFIELPQYVFRGHRRRDWLLEPTLTRQIKSSHNAITLRDNHLKSFRYAIRGRRGPNPPEIKNEHDLWAIGQHHGLATPLLDWTSSPYVALFFAFEEKSVEDESNTRVVWMLNETRVEAFSKSLIQQNKHLEAIEFLRPFSDENYRLVSQSGLFTMTTGLFDIESWVKEHHREPENTTDTVTLARIDIPNADREKCLKALNQMNINHALLFPDLHGASMFANMRLEIDKY